MIRSFQEHQPDHTAAVVVIGGGPAGAAAARLLAAWGYKVMVLARRQPGPSRAESLPPSSRKLLVRLGLLETLEGAGFYRGRGTTVWWADEGVRSQSFADGGLGYQVQRRRFDRVLLDAAEQVGAEVRRDAWVRDARMPGLDNVRHARRDADACAVVRFEDLKGRLHTIAARFVLDCSGRAGVLARRGLRQYRRDRVTLAVGATWQSRHGWNLKDDTHTLIEAYADGWAWSVPVGSDVRHVAVMVDPRVTALAAGCDLGALYTGELHKTTAFRGLVERARRTDRPWACDASEYSAAQYAGPGFLLVGDAASFIDPLSSFGIKKALASAWLAAVTIRTCLKRPSMAEAALGLYARRERKMHESYHKQTAWYFDAVARQRHHPFWTQRAEPAVDRIDAVDLDVEILSRDPGMARALETLKLVSRLVLRPGAACRIEPRPRVSDDEIVVDDHIVTPTLPEGLRFVRGVDLIALVGLAGLRDQVPDLFDLYIRSCGKVRLPDFLAALSLLVAQDVLRHDGSGGT